MTPILITCQRLANIVALRPPPPPFYLPLNVTLYLCLIANGLAALFAPIQDCDEVYNFWEPAHYLDYGYGLQTWEYSPLYSIRSWLYVSLHAAVGKLGSKMVNTKTAEFYVIRMFLGVICAACQTRLYSAICRSLHPRIGLLFLMITVFSPGMFHASAAFLPSTFTMYTSMLGLASFMDYKGGPKTAHGIMWFGLGAIVGWPFAGALIVPLLAEEIIVCSLVGALGSLSIKILNGALRCLAVLVSRSMLFRLCCLAETSSRPLKWQLTMSSSARSRSCPGILLHTIFSVATVEALRYLAPSHGHSTCGTCSSTSMSGSFLLCYLVLSS